MVEGEYLVSHSLQTHTLSVWSYIYGFVRYKERDQMLHYQSELFSGTSRTLVFTLLNDLYITLELHNVVTSVIYSLELWYAMQGLFQEIVKHTYGHLYTQIYL